MAEEKSEADQAAQAARDKALSKAYGKATQQLKEAHRDEFNALYQKAAADEGVEWSPRLSPEQKAEAEVKRLLAEYPGLSQRVLTG